MGGIQIPSPDSQSLKSDNAKDTTLPQMQMGHDEGKPASSQKSLEVVPEVEQKISEGSLASQITAKEPADAACSIMDGFYEVIKSDEEDNHLNSILKQSKATADRPSDV
jgi:hypothetical protein